MIDDRFTVFLEMTAITLTALALGTFLFQLKKDRMACFLPAGAAAVCGFELCVLLSGLEKGRPTSFSVLGTVAMFFAVAELGLLYSIKAHREGEKPGRTAIIEAFDKIDMGICYYDAEGRVILCNEYMHKLAVAIWGIRVLNGQQFLEQLTSAQVDIGRQDRFEYRLEDRWFSIYSGTIVTDGECLRELIAVDITDLKTKKNELAENNSRLRDLNRRLRDYGTIADRIIREQEILNAKMKVHDTFGNLLLAMKHAIEENLPDEELTKIEQQIKNTLEFISGMMPGNQKENGLEELMKTARNIGVAIHFSGSLPEESQARELLLPAVRECLTNTVKHARGRNLYVEIREDRIVITNDGKKPRLPILLGTGLSTLKSKVEKAGGAMRILAEDDFILEITV